MCIHLWKWKQVAHGAAGIGLAVPAVHQEERALLFFVRFDVTQPDTFTNADLIDTWRREATAALGAIEAGAIKSIYKIAGQRTVLCVIEVPSAEELDRALGGLPILREMGNGVKTQAHAVYEYTTYAEDLHAGVHGP